MYNVTVHVIENPRNEVTKTDIGRAITSTHSASFMFLDIDWLSPIYNHSLKLPPESIRKCTPPSLSQVATTSHNLCWINEIFRDNCHAKIAFYIIWQFSEVILQTSDSVRDEKEYFYDYKPLDERKRVICYNLFVIKRCM